MEALPQSELQSELVDATKLWGEILSSARETINRPTFETLSTSTNPLSFQEGVLTLAVPNEFSKNWLEERCQPEIEVILKKHFPEAIGIQFQISPYLHTNTHPIAQTIPPPTRRSGSLLNSRYTFDSFVIGQGNRFAHAAARAVGESPARAYNPLFIYGGVGLGKTHLMQAIGNYIYQEKPQAKIMYVSSEQFTNELINSIRDDRMQAFRDRYRLIDVLMVDDIQFLAGKERTQEEFFHTFNTLYESSKQIVVSSDRPPKEILTLEERLRSRFEWGLIADIQPPDLETRIAILKKKAEVAELEIPDEILHTIANKIASNIRELEGALIRVVAYCSLEGCAITPESVEQVLKDSNAAKHEKPITIDLIKKVVADFYSVRIDDMSAKTRTKEIATARQVAMFLCREMTNASLPKIGEVFGGRDHTTVMHACEKIKDLITEDSETNLTVQAISEKIRCG